MIDEIIIQDESVALIRQRGDHFDMYRKWFANDGEWQRYDAPWEKRPDDDVEEARAKYLKIIEHQDEYVGWVSIYGDDSSYSKMVGIAICEDTKLNQGIGTRALKLCIEYIFRAYQCHRIGLDTWSFNKRMIHVARKVGFVEEGREREACCWNGEWIDMYSFGILEREWENSCEARKGC